MTGTQAGESVGQSRGTNALAGKFSLVFLLISALALSGNRSVGAGAATALAANEKEECTKNLKIIYDSIEAYRKDHKDLPNWLSDLVPDYLADANVLICPVCRRTG